MYLHDDRRLVYLANPRTASMATADALMTVGFRHVSPYPHSPRNTHHARLYSVQCPIEDDDVADWTVITTVRNHWDCAVSWMPRPPEGGRKWRVEEFQTRLTNRYIPGDQMFMHADQADVIWRFETLQDDMTRTLRDHDLPMPDLTWNNWSEWRGAPFQSYYSGRTRQYLADRFAGEIARFGYGFDDPDPAYPRPIEAVA